MIRIVRANHCVILLFVVAVLLASCNNLKNKSQDKGPRKDTTFQTKVIKHRDIKKPAALNYYFTKTKKWMRDSLKVYDSAKLHIILSVNRTDVEHLSNMDSIVLPSDLNGDLESYLPFPVSVPYLKNVSKIIFFSYPSQTFGAYENGELVYTGATNMGRKKDPTPTGLYYANWKAEETISTVDDEWKLKWNFNIENKQGIGWHQYALPGYPASHSCLRLQEGDARYLYTWADQFIAEGKDSAIAKGTPVIVFGAYNFNGPKPWLQLVNNPHVLDIAPQVLEQEVSPHLQDILLQQKKRDDVAAKK